MTPSTLIRSLIRESLLLELRNPNGEGPPSSSKYFARPTGEGFVLYYGVGSDGSPQAIPGTIGFNYASTYVRGGQDLAVADYRLTPEEKSKAEEFVKMGLFDKVEKKNVTPEIAFQYRQNRNMSPESMWGDVSDVPKMYYSYRAEKQGFEFLLVDTESKLVSLNSSWKESNPRRSGGKPGTADKNKTYVIPSGNVEFAADTLSLQKLFKHLTSVDPRVTPDYKIVSPDDKFSGKTIGQVSGEKRSTDVAVGGTPGTLTVYHGTSTKRWPEIEKKGLVPGKFEVAYSDQIPGYSAKNLYFTMDPHTAENYATRAAVWDKAGALILKVEIPDITRVLPDEDSMNWFELKREYNLKRTDGEYMQGAKYDPDKGGWQLSVKPRSGQRLGRRQHVKNVLSLLRQANQSKAYGKYEDEEPNVGSEWVKDDEYYALLKDVEQGMAGFLTESLAEEIFAYKGWIPSKFIKKWKEYPRTAYPRAVDKGIGTGNEYEITRQKVLKNVKRFDKNESLVRSLVKRMIAESSPPSGFASASTHSVGWIDPDGVYHYDPDQRDHGAWAAFHIGRDSSLMPQFEDALKVELGPIDPPPPRTPEQQAVYNAKSTMSKKMDDFRRQGGRPLSGRPIPEYSNMGELYYNAEVQSEVRSVAIRTLLRNGWGKISNAYSMECWKPTRIVVNAWLDLGMSAGSNSDNYHNIFDDKKSLIEGDWQTIEKFAKRLP